MVRKDLERRFRQRIACGLALLFAATSWSTTGCREAEQTASSSPAAAPESLAPLRVLVIDDPELATVIPRQWQARAERAVAIEQTTTQEFLAAKRKRLGVDAVIYPSGLLGELAQRELIEPFSDDSINSSQFARREIFELSRLREVDWGGSVLAVTFGSPQWNLLYRRDIFARLQLTPPKTWSEYESLVKRLTDREALGELAPPADQPWAAVIEPLGPGWAGPLLLARSAAYARHRSQYSTLFDYRTMQPLIGGPPFVRSRGVGCDLQAPPLGGRPNGTGRGSPRVPARALRDGNHLAVSSRRPVRRRKWDAGRIRGIAGIRTGLQFPQPDLGTARRRVAATCHPAGRLRQARIRSPRIASADGRHELVDLADGRAKRRGVPGK